MLKKQHMLDPVNSYVYYAHHTHEIYQVLPDLVESKPAGELLNPLSNETVFINCSGFFLNKGPVNIWNGVKL